MIPVVVVALVATPPVLLYAYSRRVKALLVSLNRHNVKVTRVQEIPSDPYIKCLELDEEFVKEHWETRRMMSFGQYFSTLRFTSDSGDEVNVKEYLQQELTITFIGLVMGMLGATGGGAVLPMLVGNAEGGVNGYIAGVAATIAGWLTNGMVAQNRLLQDGVGVHATPDDQEEDIAIFPLSLTELMQVININQTLFHAGQLEVPA